MGDTAGVTLRLPEIAHDWSLGIRLAPCDALASAASKSPGKAGPATTVP